MYKINPDIIFSDSVVNECWEPTIHYNDKEKRIVFFGDSYVEFEKHFTTNWTLMLSEHYDRQHINNGWSGSSFQFSLQNFFRYLENDYRPDDYIVFITTSYMRLPKVHPDVNPGISAMLNRWIATELGSPDEMYTGAPTKTRQYMQANRQTMIYLAEVVCNQEDYRHQLKLIERYLDSLSNKTLLIHGFPNPGLTEDKFILTEVSEITNWNADINHMTLKQNKTFVQQIIKYFDTNDFSVFDIEAYK